MREKFSKLDNVLFHHILPENGLKRLKWVKIRKNLKFSSQSQSPYSSEEISPSALSNNNLKRHLEYLDAGEEPIKNPLAGEERVVRGQLLRHWAGLTDRPDLRECFIDMYTRHVRIIILQIKWWDIKKELPGRVCTVALFRQTRFPKPHPEDKLFYRITRVPLNLLWLCNFPEAPSRWLCPSILAAPSWSAWSGCSPVHKAGMSKVREFDF